MNRAYLAGIITLATGLLIGGAAFSAGQETHQKTASLSPAVTMEDAIKAATAAYPGRVVEAELEEEDGKTVYEVEIVTDGGTSREIEVDAATGKITEEESEDKHSRERESDDD